MGETVPQLDENSVIIAMFSASDGKSYPVTTRLIVNGKIFAESSGNTPSVISLRARRMPAGRKSYCRLEIRGRNNSAIVTNPIFFMRD